ncbi:thioesterase family protein-like protein [Xylogone sp. PMI_703]|nr:thioesterase family protein-like protein [Xylogone sp. PMI_703]
MELEDGEGLIFGAANPESRAFFTTIPWCRRYYDDPAFKPFRNSARDKEHAKPRYHTFVNQTMARPDAIPHWQAFHRAPQPGSGNRFGEIFNLISLGGGLNGHIDKVHGGVLSFIFDDVIGTCAWNARSKNKVIFTLYLKVEYKKAVPTPSVVLCRSWLDNEKTEGKKIFGYASIEDGEGTVMATGEALFIQKDRPGSAIKL